MGMEESWMKKMGEEMIKTAKPSVGDDPSVHFKEGAMPDYKLFTERAARERVDYFVASTGLNAEQTQKFSDDFTQAILNVAERGYGVYAKDKDTTDTIDSLIKERSDIALESWSKVNGDAGGTDSDIQKIKGNEIALATKIAVTALEDRGVEIPTEIVNRVTVMSGKSLVAILSSGSNPVIQEKEYGIEHVNGLVSSPNMTVDEQVFRAALSGTLLANGAWAVIEPLRPIMQNKPERIDPEKNFSFRPFSEMVSKRYNEGLQARSVEMGLARAVFEIAKDFSQFKQHLNK